MAGMQEALDKLLNDESYRNSVMSDPSKLTQDHPSLDSSDFQQLASSAKENGADSSWIDSITIDNCCCCCCP
jgi:hypothetical protein